MSGYIAHLNATLQLAARFYNDYLLSTYFLNMYSEIPEQLIIGSTTFNESKLICQYLQKYNLILIKLLML